ncbi:hypothetical protein DPMN_122958 [Dreissena polymorpha]|uniref:Uncharacterized protein n=1 Tax=Dreissena polymorpha TaxID=45954 RepID=A0A9D4JUX6_DREPO|nr:hypothetical protein DPMN_122958 [Dreissena polymorpha]
MLLEQLLEQQITARAAYLLLEQYLDAARPARFLPEQHFFLLQQKNSVRPAFILRISL